MAMSFLKTEKLILFHKNKKGQIDYSYGLPKEAFENKPIYVLINDFRASASEINCRVLCRIMILVGYRGVVASLEKRLVATRNGTWRWLLQFA